MSAGTAGVGYDETLFVLGGDPDSIAASASAWQSFASEAMGAAGAIHQLDTGEFAGDEADDFRRVLDADLPHRLRTSSQAWGIVGTALARFGGRLDDCQQRLRMLRPRAADAWQDMRCARDALATQQAAQRAQLAAYQGTSGDLPDGAPVPAADPAPCPAEGQLTSATADLHALLDSARSIRAEHDDARDACVAEVRRAAGMRFAEPPGWFSSLLSDVGGWIADHAPLLSTISAVLKQISSISGMLAMIPVLAPIMGPISVTTGAAAVVVDGAVMAATGQGSWSDLVLEGASMLPGAKAAMAVGTVQTAVAVNDAAQGDGSWADVLTTAAAVTVGGKGLRGKPPRRSRSASEPAPARAGSEQKPPAKESTADPSGRGADDAAPAPGKTDEYGDGVPTSIDGSASSQPGGSDVQSESHSPAGRSDFPENLTPGTENIYFVAREKVPSEWPDPIPSNKSKQGKLGIRLFGPNRDRDGIRVDVGVPNSPYPTQRVDHVIVRSNGRVLGPDGLPIQGAIGVEYQAHIPLVEWIQWREWNIP